MFQGIGKYVRDVLGIKYMPKGADMEGEKEVFHKMLENSQKKIHIVAGELNPDYFEPKFPEIIRRKIEGNSNFKVSLLFSREATNETDVIANIKDRNPKLALVWQDYPKNIIVYWVKKRPQYHFYIIDDSLLLEEKHLTETPKPILTIENNKKMANRYIEHFEKIRNHRNIVKELNLN